MVRNLSKNGEGEEKESRLPPLTHEQEIVVIRELVESLYTEVLMAEQLLCQIAKKFNIDFNIYYEVCKDFEQGE